MLKFQDDYTTLIATFEDFILLVYTIIDDLYQQFVPQSFSQRRNVTTAKMSDPEIITLSICSEQITPASVDDREGLRDFAENRLGLVLPGDKGYIGETLFEDMRTKGICLMSLKPSNYKTNWPRIVRQLIFRFRRRLETVFSQLSEQMNAEKVLAKSFQGLCTRLQNKILGHNLCMAFYRIFFETCDIGKIKHLIF